MLPYESTTPVIPLQPKGQCCVWSCSTSVLLSRMTGQCASSASLQKLQNWEEWLIDHRAISDQSDLERRKKEALKSFMKVNKLRCKVLLLGRNTPRHQPGSPIWKAALRKGTWGQKGEYEPSSCCFSILQHLMVYAVSRMGEVILPLCAVLLQANLDYCVQFWAFQYKRGIDILHAVQGRPQRWRNLRIARWQL